jgi:hypothetical protein
VSEKSADLGLCPLSPLKDVGLDFDTLLRRSARRLFPGESPDFSVRPQQASNSFNLSSRYEGVAYAKSSGLDGFATSSA